MSAVLPAIAVAAVALGGCGGSKHATTSGSTPATTISSTISRARRDAVFVETADEYEDANGKAINKSDGAQCPPSHDVANVDAKCWTWSADGLGAGTYTQTIQTASGAVIPFTFEFKDASGDVIRGTGTATVKPDVSTPPHALGHVNRFPTTLTLTGGTVVTPEYTARCQRRTARRSSPSTHRPASCTRLAARRRIAASSTGASPRRPATATNRSGSPRNARCE